MNFNFKNIQKNISSLLKSKNDKHTLYLLTTILVIYICFILISKKQPRDVFILFGMILLIYLCTKEKQTALIGGIISSILLNYFLDKNEHFTYENFDDSKPDDDGVISIEIVGGTPPSGVLYVIDFII